MDTTLGWSQSQIEIEKDADILYDIFPGSFSKEDFKGMLQQQGSFDAVFQMVLDFLEQNESHFNPDGPQVQDAAE